MDVHEISHLPLLEAKIKMKWSGRTDPAKAPHSGMIKLVEPRTSQGLSFTGFSCNMGSQRQSGTLNPGFSLCIRLRRYIMARGFVQGRKVMIGDPYIWLGPWG
jgi:hypothetical protein